MGRGADRRRALAAVVLVAAVSIAGSFARDKHYHLDTRHYAVRTLEIIGRAPGEARIEAATFLTAHAVPAGIDAVDRPEAGLFKPRILYPLLSAPFVAILGLEGLLVVPFIATVALAVLLWIAVARRAPPWVAAAAVALVILSRTFTAYGPAALTEALALALMAAALLALPDRDRPGSPMLALGATLAAGLARDVTPYLLLAALAGWWWAWRTSAGARRAWTRVAAAVGAATAVSLAWTAAAGGLGPLFQLERFTHERGLPDVIGALPPVLWRALQGTGAALARDVPLLILLAVACAVAAARLRSRDSAEFAGALLAALALLVLSPISTKFRVQLPLVLFAAPLAAAGMTARSGRGPGDAAAAHL